MLKIRDVSVVPAEDWVFYVEQTGVTLTTKSYSQLYPKILQHCLSNNVPAPSQQDVIDYLCANVHVPCFDSETRQPLINKFSLNLPAPARPGCCGQARLPK